MKKIHYKEDFPLLITMPNPCGVPTGVPDFDFSVRLISGLTEFIAGRKDGKFYNCRQESEDTICIFVDDHSLMPCAELGCEITFYIPDASMPDGIRQVVRDYPTGLSLTTESSCTCKPQFEALLPYIQGKDGERGPIGPEGPAGPIGPQGPQGEAGEQGPKGTDGKDGKSAYELAVAAGYAGTESDLAESLNEVGNVNFADLVTETELSDKLADLPTGGNIALKSSDDIIVDGDELWLTDDAKRAAIVEMWTNACAYYKTAHKVDCGKYDPTNAPDSSKPFQLNGLWLSWSQAETALGYFSACATQGSKVGYFRQCSLPTIFPICANYNGTIGIDQMLMGSQCVKIVLITSLDTNHGSLSYTFSSCPKLEEVTGEITASNLPSFWGTSKLREIRFRRITSSSSAFTNTPLISAASLRYLVQNAANTNAITLTVHKDTYAKITGNTESTAFTSLSPEEQAEWSALVDMALAKNITFATV